MKERPLECSSCNKPVHVCFQEISLESKSSCSMCKDCPILSAKLHGQFSSESSHESWQNDSSKVVCECCHTSLDEVVLEGLVGCPACYDIFQDAILLRLCQQEEIPQELIMKIRAKAEYTLHPSTTTSSQEGSELHALYANLQDAVEKENYELAAILRDKIKKLGTS